MEVVNDPTPLERVADPITVPPFRKVTVPVGAVVPLAGFTVATRVIGEFCVTAAADAVSVVAVFTFADESGLTVTTTILDEDALKATAPE